MQDLIYLRVSRVSAQRTNYLSGLKLPTDILNSATWYQEKDLLGDLMAELRFKCIISKLNYLNCWSWELIFWSRLTREL